MADRSSVTRDALRRSGPSAGPPGPAGPAGPAGVASATDPIILTGTNVSIRGVAFGGAGDWNTVGLSSVNIGPGTDTGDQCVAVGEGAQATGAGNSAGCVAYGFGSLATGTDSTAFGALTVASGAVGNAFGDASTASGDLSVSFGPTSTAAAVVATAIGAAAAWAPGDVAIGQNCVASPSLLGGQENVVIGSASITDGHITIVIGQGNFTDHTNVLLLGNGVNSLTDDSVYLGSAASPFNSIRMETAAGPTTLSPTLQWGNDSVGAAADTRFLSPGYSSAIAQTAEIGTLLPRRGIIQKMRVRHNAAVGDGDSVVYTLMLNGVATALTCTLASGAIGSATDLVNQVAVTLGSRVALRATKALGITVGGVQVTVTCEYL